MRNICGTVWVYIQFICKVVIKPERLTLSSLHTIVLNYYHPLIQQFSTLFSGCQDMGLVTHMHVMKQRLCIIPGALSKHPLQSPTPFSPAQERIYKCNYRTSLAFTLYYEKVTHLPSLSLKLIS